MKRILSIAEIGIILVVAIAPVFASLPYRINIFLSWEGAYRMSEGQIPYKDFGIPVGYMYWVIPALFFKFFGAYLITLVKAQAFLNIVAGFAFRSVFKSLKIDETIRFLAVLVFSLSYTFPNYWPWYNHTVIVYELVAVAFLIYYIFPIGKKQVIWLIFSGIFIFFSFFTKQDGGGLAFLLCMALLAYHCRVQKRWTPLFIFAASVLLTGLLMILPLTGYQFNYWFNHGQFPHSSRISLADIIREFLAASQWLKFYGLLITILLLTLIRKNRHFLHDQQFMIFFLLTAGMMAEAAVFQVTSYVPVDNNIFFHAFALAFILYLLQQLNAIQFREKKLILIATAGVLLWWSQSYWKYVERILFRKEAVPLAQITYEGYHYNSVVNRNTYMINLDTTDIPLNKWRVPNSPSFKKILVPEPTAAGIERLFSLQMFNNNKNLRVLNMTELTPLAKDLPFKLETGSYYPLWFHKGVGMFERETMMFENRIHNHYYDLVLFEYIPYLNNFYPFRIREALRNTYQQIDVFPAPRKPATDAWIEVYVKKR